MMLGPFDSLKLMLNLIYIINIHGRELSFSDSVRHMPLTLAWINTDFFQL